MDEIPVAVVGLGSRGLGWVKRLQAMEGYRVVAVCDRIPALVERAVAALDRPLGVKRYVEYEEVLADADVAAVELTVRCREQGALAAQGLEAGKHVCSEVPAAHTRSEERRVGKECRTCRSQCW